MVGWIHGRLWVGGWVDGAMHRWMDGQMDGRMGKWMDGGWMGAGMDDE